MRLSHKIVLMLVVFALGISGLMLAFSTNQAHKTSEIFPQNQDCQPEAAALRVRFAPPPPHWQSPAVPAPQPQTRTVTNCRRLDFQFFLNTLELTGLHFGLLAGSIWEKLYGLNGNGEKDLIVHVSHVQPAVSIKDPTISTNLYLLAFAHHLQLALANNDGNREPLEGYDLDRFRPYDAMLRRHGLEERKLFFMSRREADVELVGQCELPLGKSSIEASSWCRALAYSQQDGLVFALTLPHAELDRLNDIVERTLDLIRSWRAAA